MTRVALVINELGLGGAERLVTELARGLPSFGFLPQIVSLDADGVGREPEDTVRLGFRRTDPRVVGALTRWLRAHRVEVVHLHLPRAGVIGRLAARWAGCRPVVYTEHNARTGYGPLVRWANTFTLGWNDHIIAVAEHIRQDLLAAGVPGAAVTTIHNGIDVVEAQIRAAGGAPLRALLGVAEETPVMGTVANLHPRKGLDTFVQGLARLRALHPRAIGVIIGRDDGDGRRIRGIARRERIADALHMLGPRTDALALLRQFDVFALSSRIEGLPVALLEAMALRRPVVGTSVGGMPEVIRDMDTGRLIAPGNPELLAAAVGALLTDRGGAAAMGMRAAEFVETQFSMAKMLAAHATLYGGLLGGTRTGRTA